MNQTSEELLIKWKVAQNNLQNLEKKEKDIKDELSSIETSLSHWNGAKVLLELLKNYKLEKRKEFILSIINNALSDIFESDYRLDIVPREIKGKSAASTQKYDIVFYQNGIEIARNDDLLTSNGGGVLSVASLFFKILIGYLYSKNKFYIFDEALSQVSPQYRERLSLFLQKFCEKYGFTLVVVSQTEELEIHADLVYEVDSSIDEKDVPVLEIKNIIGEIPHEDFYYLKIKNFQSIQNQSFKFKGFTIIRGPNNSGKSASLRAIEAVIFNNFNTTLYPRKNPGGKKLLTEITFGHYFNDKKASVEIQLKYKSGKVLFVIDGEEYYGKNLAADRLKEEVEKIGFRYIDVKQMYKNFRGDLKEQTERIAYTNQYDGLFLIGSKTSDNEKIFSFLFNTENIALAIARTKEALQEMGKQHKELQNNLSDTIDEINIQRKKIEYYNKLYYYLVIQEYLHINDKKKILGKKVDIYIELLNRLNIVVQLFEAANWLDLNNARIIDYKNKLEHNNMDLSIIERILDKIKNHQESSVIINILNTKQYYQNKLRSINGVLPYYNAVILISKFIELFEKKQQLQELIHNFELNELELNRSYSLIPCDCCNGLGVRPL